MTDPPDPRSVRVVAVTADDVVTALEANYRDDPTTVLRITPPFSGRMRARLHRVAGDEPLAGRYDRTPRPVHVPPRDLVADPPEYPDPDGTEDRLRADPDADYTLSVHRRRHAARVERWRDRVRKAIVDAVELDVPSGRHRVDVAVLG